MASIVLFHSVLGVRPGVLDARDRLQAAGHDVRVVDLYDGRVFDDYAEGSAFEESLGYGVLLGRAVDAVADMSDEVLVAGFSSGCGMAQYVASQRKVGGVLLFSGALAPARLGIAAWPDGVPVQIHFTVDDPFRNQDGIDAVLSLARNAGSEAEMFDYPGSGHLFTDPSMHDEFDARATEVFWRRVLDAVSTMTTAER